jgi:arsenite oxidase small subunit
MTCCKDLVEMGRRQFFRGGAAAAASVVLMAPQATAAATPDLARVSYAPRLLANQKDLAVDVPLEIFYPDAASPGVLLKLGRRVAGGVGPDGDIVAFSTLCPHKGFPLAYSGDDKSLNCRAHYSRFDPEAAGQQIWGHATQNLPQFELRVDAKGDIYAEGVDELLYGRLSNVLQG